MATIDEQEAMRIDKALKFCGGSLEKAREMLSGSFKDLMAIKCRFLNEETNIFGAFLLFAKCSDEFCAAGIACVLDNKDEYDKISIRDFWKTFHTTVQRLCSTVGAMDVNLKKCVTNCFDEFNLYSEINARNVSLLITKCEEALCKYMDIEKIYCDLEFEACASIELLEASINVLEAKEDENAENAEQAGNVSEISADVPAIESGAECVFSASSIVSPVKGIYIENLKEGDKIKLIPLDKNDTIDAVTKAQHANGPNGEVFPLIGKVKLVEKRDKETIIYCAVAKNILAKIVEKENVRIEPEIFIEDKTNDEANTDEKEKNKIDFSFYISIFVFIIIFIILLAYAFS